MEPAEQRGLIDMIHEEDPEVVQDLISSLMESFSEHWAQDPAYQKLGNIMDNIIANESPESPHNQTMTYKEDDGYWHAMNGQELVRRLVAMTHGKMKKPDPDGFGIALQHFSRNIPILAYVGDYARRAFTARYNTQIPRRQELVNGTWQDVQPKGRRNIRAIREHDDDEEEVINISDT